MYFPSYKLGEFITTTGHYYTVGIPQLVANQFAGLFYDFSGKGFNYILTVEF